MRHPYYITLFLLLILSQSLLAQSNDWKKKKDVDNMEIYTCKVPGSDLYQLKIVTDIEAPLNTIVAVLDDVPGYSEWVYKCRKPNIIARTSETSYIYSVESAFPFPASDRDIVIDYYLKQDSITKEITTISKAVPDYAPLQDGIVRVTQFDSKYIIRPISKNWTHVEYFLNASPGGSIPDWIVNLGISIGPRHTIQGLIDQVKKEKYQNLALYVRNF